MNGVNQFEGVMDGRLTEEKGIENRCEPLSIHRKVLYINLLVM